MRGASCLAWAACSASCESKRTRGRSSALSIATAPKYPLRGHQLGYRPKTNSYDAWTVPMWEQYIRDLAVFGTNAIELIPPRSDDAADSPHFPLPQMQMMVEMSRIADEYGLDVWIWYPAMDAEYSEPEDGRSALDEWADVFKRLPRIDAVFVPGGDPGHTDPRVLCRSSKNRRPTCVASIRKRRCGSRRRASPRNGSTTSFDLFEDEEPSWLAGVVYGPQIRISLPELRAAIPKKYPIRRYPDITHRSQCQFPVPDWDIAYAVTEGREVINPRPRDEATIFRALAETGDRLHHVFGRLQRRREQDRLERPGLGSGKAGRGYSARIRPVLHRRCVRRRLRPGALGTRTQLARAAVANRGVMTTLQQFQAMERAAPPAVSLNWRSSRPCTGRTTTPSSTSRLAIRNRARGAGDGRLRAAAKRPLLALPEAESVLDRAVDAPGGAGLRARVFELGDALFQSIRMQLSVERYQAIGVDRGATLDTIDRPLNSRLWLKARFAEIRKMAGEEERLESCTRSSIGPIRARAASTTTWATCAPAASGARRRLQGRSGVLRDAAVRFHYRAASNRLPRLLADNVETLYDGPLKMQYDELDPHAQYAVRISYASDSPARKFA